MRIAVEAITLQQLQAINYQVDLPFKLHLNGQSIQCEQLLRVVPGKRLVFRASLNAPNITESSTDNSDKKKIIIKLFLHASRAKKHCLRELEGAQLLMNHHIKTPELITQGVTDEGIHCLLFAYLEGQNLAAFWAENTPKARVKKLHELMPVLVQHHNAGLTHQDLHYANFLLSHGVYTLDGEEVKASATPLKKKIRLQNLALFLAQTFDLSREHHIELLDIYLSLSKIELSAKEKDIFLIAIKVFQQGRIKHYLKKILRDCTDIMHTKSKQSETLCRREYHNSSIQRLLDQPELFFQHENATFLKQGNTCTVKSIVVNNEKFVVKRYNPKGIAYELKHQAQWSRAKRSWLNAHLLRFMGIKTPEPIAFIEHRPALGKRCSYFICKYQQGQSSWDFFCDSDKNNTINKQPAAENLVKTLLQLCQYQITHGDLKGSNFIIDNNNTWVLDLDAMTQHKTLWRFKQNWQRDKMRFFKNWDKKACYKNWQQYFMQALK
ncbi:lipopolysaccharide kinase InaA family protein [sulfur-oxidizing endosymbiont of Gigantopelta aegis]|uniref:lipopolysaccharide kinase InaA family protein n=1 Tax=sulfur-oxidizing endosymbiont of Gigantopelta aegis TaxID=2794934 RepID=UPI0018DE656F|nr:lipopolysaccharide kinase InaA family protein [sulfur-oxidizing endosymbiont of Gigantopelta aegis]